MEAIMMHQQAAAARADFTQEPLEVVRLHIGQFDSFARLIPQAEGTQALLEALFLSTVARSTTSVDLGTAPFGVIDVSPLPNRLDVHLAGPEAFRPVLDLLPARARDKTIHGIAGLLARPVRTAVHVAFDHKQASGELRLWTEGADLAELLAEHAVVTKARGHRVLWSTSSPLPKPKLVHGRRAVLRVSRQKPSPVTPPVRTSQFLASTLLRRPGIWTRLEGHLDLRISSSEVEHGVDWLLDRIVTPRTAVHDERIPRLLGDAIAGPDLIWDRASHACGPEECRMRFVPRESGHGWNGVLTVRTVRAISEHRPARRPRPFTVLAETLVRNKISPLHPGRKSMLPPSDGHGRNPGLVVQLESVGCSLSKTSSWKIALHVAAGWALQGWRVLVVHDVMEASRQPAAYPAPTWPVRTRPMAPTGDAPWQRLRLTNGPGELHLHVGSHSWETLEKLIPQARADFDWIILADSISDNYRGFLGPTMLDGITDRFVVAVEDPGYTTTIAVASAGGLHATDSGRHVDLTPAESATVWRERNLRTLANDIPVAGLILVPAGGHPQPSLEFRDAADTRLADFGTPVLTRLTSELISEERTVLDNVGRLAREDLLATSAHLAHALAMQTVGRSALR
ncbi:hypothetical protein ACFQ6N_31945 [Kitasatospora sp. NPDC056446]|uniref:hypothetical protein n=1 Tax=Kitasatospora sp. NPDC056446 TaxID=3345819 RepID=UPI00369CB6C0